MKRTGSIHPQLLPMTDKQNPIQTSLISIRLILILFVGSFSLNKIEVLKCSA